LLQGEGVQVQQPLEVLHTTELHPAALKSQQQIRLGGRAAR
jgi:hypothetical protein